MCKSFIEHAMKMDDIINTWVREKGINEVMAYMEDEINSKYADHKTKTYRVTLKQMIKILNHLRNVFVEKTLGDMVDEGYLTESIMDDGEILYTRTDKVPPPEERMAIPPPDLVKRQTRKPKRKKNR